MGTFHFPVRRIKMEILTGKNGFSATTTTASAQKRGPTSTTGFRFLSGFLDFYGVKTR
jgi:hypothetical protein